MEQKKSFIQFVEDAKSGDLYSHSLNQIQDLVQSAIDYYDLKSFIQLNIAEEKKVLHIVSMAEENILTKIVQIAIGNEDITVEFVFEGYVIRRH